MRTREKGAPDLLKEKLGKAASAFWNSGGGLFVIGASSSGELDEGFPAVVGRQPRRDWIDQILAEVQPAGGYSVQVFQGNSIESHPLAADRAIVAITFDESHLAPHMAPDGRYYIRAGAHSVTARSFIVEALWARRHQRQPQLIHMLRAKPTRSDVLQLLVINISPEPALNVQLTPEPLPEIWKDSDNPFPLVYPVVDKASPIEIDVTAWHMSAERIGPKSKVFLTYSDGLKRTYGYEKLLYVRSFTPWQIGSEIVKATEKVGKAFENGFSEIARWLREFKEGARHEEG